MLGVIGIVVALVVLVALTFKGWHMGVVAIASSLIIILTSKFYKFCRKLVPGILSGSYFW